MKSSMRVLLVVLVGLLVATAAFGQSSSDSTWNSLYHPGNVTLVVGGGLGFAFSLGAYAGVEVIYSSVKADDSIPFDFGILVMGMYNWFSRTDDDLNRGWDAYAGGALATVHLTFNDLEEHALPFLENLDFYTGLGVVYNYLDFKGEYRTTAPAPQGPGLATLLGANYHLAKWFALNLELASWAFTGGIKLGIMLKI